MGGSNLGIRNGSCELEDAQRTQQTLISKQDGVILLHPESSVLLRTSVCHFLCHAYGIWDKLSARSFWTLALFTGRKVLVVV